MAAVDTTLIGARGEEIATEWLRARGYMIVSRNWRDGRYEVDIIAQRGFSLHFVEVKTRQKGGLNAPEAAITEDKQRSMLRAARGYLASHPSPLEPQLDLIAIEVDPITLEHEVRYTPQVVQCSW